MESNLKSRACFKGRWLTQQKYFQAGLELNQIYQHLKLSLLINVIAHSIDHQLIFIKIKTQTVKENCHYLELKMSVCRKSQQSFSRLSRLKLSLSKMLMFNNIRVRNKIAVLHNSQTHVNKIKEFMPLHLTALVVKKRVILPSKKVQGAFQILKNCSPLIIFIK